jgi:hypothetical protein
MIPRWQTTASASESAMLVPLMPDQQHDQPEAQLEPMVACGDHYRPTDGAAPSVLTVVTLDLSAPSISGWTLETVGLLADGWTVYASTRSLCVAQTSLWWWASRGDLDMSTTIHKLVLDETSDEPVRYAATGEVPAWLLNQLSMSVHADHLRVATTRWDWWWGTGSGDEEQGSVLSVLRDNQRGRLEVVGQIDHSELKLKLEAVEAMHEADHAVDRVPHRRLHQEAATGRAGSKLRPPRAHSMNGRTTLERVASHLADSTEVRRSELVPLPWLERGVR